MTKLKKIKITVEESTAFKNYTKMTAQNVVKANKFHKNNKTTSYFASYSYIVIHEKELDVGYDKYKLINKEYKTKIKVHEKTTEQAYLLK